MSGGNNTTSTQHFAAIICTLLNSYSLEDSSLDSDQQDKSRLRTSVVVLTSWNVEYGWELLDTFMRAKLATAIRDTLDLYEKQFTKTIVDGRDPGGM